MRVELDVYSGRENPAWQLSESDTRQLIDRLANRTLAAIDDVEGVLGFRGYIISAEDDVQGSAVGLPEVFRLGGGALPQEYAAPEGAAPALPAQEADDAALWLLSTTQAAVDDDLLSYVEGVVKTRGAVQEQEGVTDLAAACVIQTTPYNPAFWNTPAVQPRNNCYNYAMNHRTDTFAQPGRISGHPNSIMQCANVAAAANWDGCTAACSGSNKNVALVIWPGNDYHWYRLHSNGFWGHKPGGTAARNTDNLGRVIGGGLNPANCARGPYTIFCGYRFSPTGMRVR